jgi:uncharacterized protein (TIGR03790 family)
VTSRLFLRLLILLAGVSALILPGRALALQPDEIALIVNSNVPESTQLAQFYATARHIPDNRILVLDLPVGDDISFKDYEEQVVPKVREFLVTGQLQDKVKCFVTFYGVPLRISDRVNTAAEQNELANIRATLVGMPNQLKPAVESLESLATKLNPEFKVQGGAGRIDELMGRYGRAGVEIETQIRTLPPASQVQTYIDYFKAIEPMQGQVASIRRRAMELQQNPGRKAEELPKLQTDADDFLKRRNDNEQLKLRRFDATARAKQRDFTRDELGLAEYVRVLDDQVSYLDPDQSGSAFDSELSLVCWTEYTRNKWINNPLNFNVHGKLMYPTYMTSRLDATTPDLVKSMITTGIEVEAKGLSGRVVLDSLGAKPGSGPTDHPEYGEYDQHFRDLADYLKTQTKLDVYIEETEGIIPAGSQSDVALYCGWHSAGQFVNSCKFVPGAVGYHIASYELRSLRSPGDNGWVKGLESAGVVSTLGPVAEPYLQAFPRPDQYFPLILTGKLTTTEVYWKTVPWTSWMMACVGDPLYNPYKNHPVLTTLDLPFALRAALQPTTNLPDPVRAAPAKAAPAPATSK